MDDRERDKFYSPPAPADDDDEYELEPPDPAVVAAEERHAKYVAEQARDAIDIDEIYREADRSRGTEILENWIRNFQYRFHIKHLLFATAVLTIVLAVASLGYLGLTLTALVVGSAASLYLYLNWEERKQQADAYEKREKLYAQRRARLQGRETIPKSTEPLSPVELTPPSVQSSSTEAADLWGEEAEPFRIQFSLRSLLIAMTVAAISFGLISALGAGPMATILGLLAVAGLVVHAVGFEPQQSVVLGWWFILLLYVLLTIARAVG